MLVSLVLGKLSVVFGGPRLVATHNIYDIEGLWGARSAWSISMA